VIVDPAALLDAVVTAAEQNPALADRLRALLAPAVNVEPVAIYQRVSDYAARIGVSKRTGWSLVAAGMPTIGAGRYRRVDVARADEWLRARSQTDDAIERRARADASRAGRKATA